MVYRVVSLVLLVVVSSTAYILLENEDPEHSIIWPSDYHYSAELIDLTDSYIETSEAWYSGEHNRSRIDYYNGTNKIYYYAETDDDSGYKFTFHPVSTEEVRNANTCFRKVTHGEQRDFLPDVSHYKYKEQIELNGIQVHVWKAELLKEGELKADYTLIVYRSNDEYDVPLKEEKILYDLTKGVLESHTITNYKRFEFTVDVDDVTVADEDDCEDFSFVSEIASLHPHSSADLESAFNSFKTHHSKKYSSSEHDMRKSIFHKNWRRVVSHNSKKLSYKMGLNQFSDRTAGELQYLTGTKPTDPSVQGTIEFPHTNEELESLAEELPKSYDLRLEGNLGPIKNQGNCGSCWAFTTTATVEGMTSKFYGGRNLDLSEQSLVDCAWGFENMGCSGGQLDKAYEYILKHGIPRESDYGQYIMKDGFCNLNNDTETFKIKGFARVTPRNPLAMKVALVKYGPVAVAIHASQNLKLYSSGIFYDISCEDESVNHGVVVVGYGERDGTPYWIIRNSWGESFGLDGYVLMSAVNNNCFVMDTPFYPIV